MDISQVASFSIPIHGGFDINLLLNTKNSRRLSSRDFIIHLIIVSIMIYSGLTFVCLFILFVI